MSALQAVVGEVESHVAEAGWDQPPQLFALVSTEELLRAEPQLATTMGIVAGAPDALTPVAQEALGEGPLDEALARIEFGEAVLGVVLAHEVVVLPPSAEQELGDDPDPQAAAQHPEAREMRMVVGVVRDGSRAAVLRVKAAGEGEDDRLTGPDLAPQLAEALLATLA